MIERFTDRARRVVDGAVHDARGRGHAETCIGHFLISLMSEGFGSVSAMLVDQQLDEEKIGAAMASVGLEEAGTTRLSETAKLALSRAVKMADELEHKFIGPDLLILALLSTDEGHSPVLAKLGLDPVELTGRARAAMERAATESRKTGHHSRETTRRVTALFRRDADGTTRDRLAVSAKRIIALARQEALQMDSPKVGSGHLLLGLLRENTPGVTAMANAVGFDLDQVRAQLASVLAAATPDTEGGSPLTVDAREILELAATEADDLSEEDVGAEHLLLGILKHADCSATRTLQELGCDIRYLRAIVDQTMG